MVQLNWLGLSQQQPVVSIVHDGQLYTSGRSFARNYPPGALDKLFKELGHDAPAIVSVNEEERENFAELLIASMRRIGWSFLNARSAGPNIALWFAPGDLPAFDDIIGASNNGGTEPKDQAKRNGVMSPVNSTSQGAFVSRGPSRLTPVVLDDGTKANSLGLTLPSGETLRALAIPENPEATDGDMLISATAVFALAAATEIEYSAEDLLNTDAVQLLALGNDAGIKAMGQHGGRVPWPERFQGFDLVVGQPGLLLKTQREITAGKLTILRQPRERLTYFAADGLESVVNCWLLFFKAEDIIRYQHLTLVKDVWQRQMKALQKQEPLDDWNQDLRRRDEDEILNRQIWREETELKRSLGQLARATCASPFSHPEAMGPEPRTTLRIVRRAIDKGTTQTMPSFNDDRMQRANPQRPAGLPYAIIPGFTLKRAYHEFAGVAEPEYGWATLLWRRNGTPYAFVLNAAQYADPDEFHRQNGADGDDHWNSAMGVLWNGDPYLVNVRPPNSPDNGNAYRVTGQDFEKWKRVAAVLPLKSEWHQIPNPSQTLSKLDMGPELTPPAPTRDLDVKLQVARFGASQQQHIGRFANLVQALYTAGCPAEDLNFNGSNMPDNVWLQNHDGAHVVQQLLEMAVQWELDRKTWYEPHASRVAFMVAQQHTESSDQPVRFKTEPNPEYDGIWNALLKDEDHLDVIDATLFYRVNGNADKLVTPAADQMVAVLAAKTVQTVRSIRRAEFQQLKRIRYRKGLHSRARRRQTGEVKARAIEQIRNAVEKSYRQSREFLLRRGDFATALRQAGIVFAYRWERPTNQSYRTPASQRWLPKPPYSLMHYLPEPEQEAHFKDGGFLPTGPSWIARMKPTSKDVRPEPGRRYTVQKSGNRWALVPEKAARPSPS